MIEEIEPVPSELVTEKEMAKMLSMQEHTLALWRRDLDNGNTVLPHIYKGKKVFYDLVDVSDYFDISVDDLKNLLTISEVIERYEVKETQLSYLRKRGKGPEYITIGFNLVRYIDREVVEWYSKKIEGWAEDLVGSLAAKRKAETAIKKILGKIHKASKAKFAKAKMKNYGV